jgi:hypothetical protein
MSAGFRSLLARWMGGGGANVSADVSDGFEVSVQVQFTRGEWSDVSNLVLNQIRCRRGIDGNGPLDRVAATGELHAVLRNDEGTESGVLGNFSPGHTNAIPGWTFGIPIRVLVTYGGVDYVLWTGKVHVIDPDPGVYGLRNVRIVAYDVMSNLADADAREVSIQVNQSEDDLLQSLIDIMPESSQPTAVDFDAGVDTYPYAFDNLSGGAGVLAVMRDLVVSSFGLLYADGEGTLHYRSRHQMATTTSLADLTDSELIDLRVPSSLDGVFNRARATNHPKQVSATATDTLYTLPPGTSVEVPIGATAFEIWTDYTDPNDRQTNIGGTDVVEALVANTHYVANSQADGLGADMTASTTPTLEAFSTTAKWTFNNTSGASIFLTTQKVIGKAVRDPGPQTFEHSVVRDYGDRPIEIDLPYQDDPFIGQSVSEYVVSIYSELTQQIESVAFVADESDALMTQALQREIGDRITVTEEVTGLTAVDAVIQSVEYEFANTHLICRWGLAPGDNTRYWQLGIAGASELGETTVLGF